MRMPELDQNKVDCWTFIWHRYRRVPSQDEADSKKSVWVSELWKL